MFARKIPGITLLSSLLMKTYGKQQDSPNEMQFMWGQKNLERLVRWELEDPANKRYKFPGFENMEHYDRPWVVDEIVDNVGEVDLNRCAETHAKLQSARKKLEDTNSVSARD